MSLGIASLFEMALVAVATRVPGCSWCFLPREIQERLSRFEVVPLPGKLDVDWFVSLNDASLVSQISSGSLVWYIAVALRKNRISLADTLLEEYEKRGIGKARYTTTLIRIQKTLLRQGNDRRLERYARVLKFRVGGRRFLRSRLKHLIQGGNVELFWSTVATFRSSSVFSELFPVSHLFCETDLVRQAVKAGNLEMVLEITRVSDSIDWYECLGAAIANGRTSLVDTCMTKGNISGEREPYYDISLQEYLAKAVRRGHVEAINRFLDLSGSSSDGTQVLIIAFKSKWDDLISHWWKPQYVTEKVVSELFTDWDSPWLLKALSIVRVLTIPTFQSDEEKYRWLLPHLRCRFVRESLRDTIRTASTRSTRE